MTKFILILTGTFFIMLSGFNSAKVNEGLEIRNGIVKIEGVKVSPDFQLAAFKKALGEPNRLFRSQNLVHTYDNMGILLFETLKDTIPAGTIAEFQFYLSFGDNLPSVTPVALFPEDIKIDNYLITKDLPLSDFRAKMLDWNETNSNLEHIYRFSNKGIYMYIQYDNTDKIIRKFSFGKVKSSFGAK
jgi:hypothetical protein